MSIDSLTTLLREVLHEVVVDQADVVQNLVPFMAQGLNEFVSVVLVQADKRCVVLALDIFLKVVIW